MAIPPRPYAAEGEEAAGHRVRRRFPLAKTMPVDWYLGRYLSSEARQEQQRRLSLLRALGWQYEFAGGGRGPGPPVSRCDPLPAECDHPATLVHKATKRYIFIADPYESRRDVEWFKWYAMEHHLNCARSAELSIH